MTPADPMPERARAEQALRLMVAGVIGQVGCLTLVIILLALLAGLWLDSRFDTRPLFVLILVLGSVPVTLYLMVRLVLSVAPRIQMTALQATRPADQEGRERGDASPDTD